ncbi:MAG: hypothetical protein HOW73_05640 [Polyangiaceae bacterium]|nr:hypothetical protein [Polyangiaceae bacterium]
MASGGAQVQAWIKAFQKLPQEVRAEKMADVVLEDVKRTAAAGTSPTGVAWPEKKDGGRALANAADHLSTVVSGSTVHLVLTGPDAIHNYGTGKDPKRQVLPTILPQTMAEKLTARVFKLFRGALGIR